MSSKETQDSGDATAVLVLLGIVAVIFLTIPTVLGLAIWRFVARGRLRRFEYGVILGLCLVVGVVGRVYFWEYIQLVVGLVLRRPNEIGLVGSTIAVGVLTAFVMSVAGLLDGTGITEKLPDRFRKHDPLENPQGSVLPSEKEREKVRVMRPTPLYTQTGNHSLRGGPDVPKGVSIGISHKGVPVVVTEKEWETHAFVFGSTGSGKALALDTPIPTPEGWTTMGDVKVGDQLLDDNGRPCWVQYVTEPQHDRTCYRVKFGDGSSIVADGDHKWVTYTTNDATPKSRTTNELLNDYDTHNPQTTMVHYITSAGTLSLSPHYAAHPDARRTHLMHLIRTNTQNVQSKHLAELFAPSDASLSDTLYVLETTIALVSQNHHNQPDSYPPLSLNTLGHLLWYFGAEDPSVYGQWQTPDWLNNTQPLLWSATQQQIAATIGKQFLQKYGRSDNVSGWFLAGLTRETQDVIRDLTLSVGGMMLRHSNTAFTVLLPAPGADRLAHQITEIVPTESVPVKCIQVDSESHLYLAGESYIPTHNTETLKVVAGGLADLGWSGVVLDLKEDTKPGGLRDWCDQYAATHSIPYQELRLSDPEPGFWFNPLDGLGRDEARDLVLSLMEFDDEHWQNINKLLLGQILKLMFQAHQLSPETIPTPSMYEVGKFLGGSTLKNSAKPFLAVVKHAMPHLQLDEEYRSLLNPTKHEQDTAPGFGAKILQIYDTQAGRVVLRPDESGRRQPFDVTASGLQYIGLDSSGKRDLTAMISAAVLQRFSVEAGLRTTGRRELGSTDRPRFVIIDEANWVNRDIVQNLLARARSAKMSIILATQGPLDWKSRTGDDFPRLAQNINVALVMAQGEPESARVCAEFIGGEDRLETTFANIDGTLENSGTARWGTTYRVSPDQLRGLTIGEMVLRVNKPTERVEYVKVIQRDPTQTALPPVKDQRW